MNHTNAVVSHAEWVAARKQLLTREKELMRLRDELSAARRSLPWERVEKTYLFQTEAGNQPLSALFGDKRQLAVYHLMFAPDWERACKSCSFWADHFHGIEAHLAQRDVRFTAISRAPLPKLQAFARRMGWSFPWVSSSETDFNFDYEVSIRPEERAAGTARYNYERTERGAGEHPGISVFYKDDAGAIFHTYSTYARGIELVNATYQWLDMMPRGRDEAGLSYPMAWVKHHDDY